MELLHWLQSPSPGVGAIDCIWLEAVVAPVDFTEASDGVTVDVSLEDPSPRVGAIDLIWLEAVVALVRLLNPWTEPPLM